MDLQIPDTSTVWRLWYIDTFDRDSPPSLQASGDDILRGLYELWRYTLAEGILDSGSASFSYFYLTWGNLTAARIDAGVQPFQNASLLKLRQWMQEQKQSSLILHRLAELHYELLQERDRGSASPVDWSAEARVLLKRVEGIMDPAEL